MNTISIKDNNGKYFILKCKRERLNPYYQLLERTIDFPKGRVIGEYKTKKDVLEAYRGIL
jgi:hypothetical protein